MYDALTQGIQKIFSPSEDVFLAETLKLQKIKNGL